MVAIEQNTYNALRKTVKSMLDLAFLSRLGLEVIASVVEQNVKQAPSYMASRGEQLVLLRALEIKIVFLPRTRPI